VTLGTAFGCPFEGAIDPARVLELAARLVGAGADEVVFADTVGVGGCPFAPRATGNVCTEDLVYLLHGEGVETGIDLDGLVEVAKWLEGVLGRELEGMVYRAGVFAPVAG
jgi:hydroxymethylglutaryl-CoA lyase/(R)-citramalyl-CoA lyase